MSGWNLHSTQLPARIRRLVNKPDLICINETFVNEIVEHIMLEEYRRSTTIPKDGHHGEGIAAFAAMAEHLILMENLENAERFWLMVHTHHDPHIVLV